MLTDLPVQRLILAPMEGVLDGAVRELLTAINPFDYCVTEFVRVTQHRLTKRTFYRLCPELQQQGKTQSGTPVRIQLLGQSPQWMAENAVLAAELGSYGIDINAGCPAKTVVGSQGGAWLLQYPELLYQITQACRQALPKTTPLSVKVRLGWQDTSLSHEIVQAVQQGGADEIVIHGRTKADGYRAEAINWPKIAELKQLLSIPVIANGEIFTPDNARQCLKQSQTADLMLGRGILQTPNLAACIKFGHSPLSWPQVVQLLLNYTQQPDSTYHTKPYYHSARIKQWLSYLRQSYPQARELLSTIRLLKSRPEIQQALAQYRAQL